MEVYNKTKAKKAQRLGSLYFALLGIINFGATLLYAELNSLDFIILLLGFLPLLITKRNFHLVFGIVTGLISLYMGYACLLFNFNSAIQTSQSEFLMGYLFIGATLFASILLIYAGFDSPEKKELSPV